MPEQEPITDPFLIQLLEGYTLAEVAEIQLGSPSFWRVGLLV